MQHLHDASAARPRYYVVNGVEMNKVVTLLDASTFCEAPCPAGSAQVRTVAVLNWRERVGEVSGWTLAPLRGLDCGKLGRWDPFILLEPRDRICRPWDVHSPGVHGVLEVVREGGPD